MIPCDQVWSTQSRVGEGAADASCTRAGDQGIAKFLTMVPLADHVKSIQVTNRASRVPVQELYELLKGHNGKKAGKGGRAKRKK